MTMTANKPTTIVCQHCQCRENRKEHENSGFCSALKIFVMRKDKRASTCNLFKRRKGAKIFDAPME
jgi:hypothetical protein